MPSNATIGRDGKASMIMIPAKNYEHPSLAYIDLGIVRLILIDSSNQGQLEFIWTGGCSSHGPLLLDRSVCLPLFAMWHSYGYFSTVI